MSKFFLNFFQLKIKILRSKFINGIFLIVFKVLYLLELGSNDNFMGKLVKRYVDDIRSILNWGQSYLDLNVESEIQILIGF